MKPPTLSPASPRELAIELAREANSRKDGPRWGLLPFQRHQLEDTVWWIRKGAGNPAYDEFKAAIFPSLHLAHPEETLVGVALEKGYGPKFESTARTRKERNQVMKASWAWHRVFPSIRAGAMVEPCRKIETLGLRPCVYVSATGGARSLFDVMEGTRLKLARGTSLPRVSDWQSLCSAIGPAIEEDWHWLNLYVGVLFMPVASGGKWTAERLWPEVVAPLLGIA